MTCAEMETTALRQLIAEASGVLAHREGGKSVDEMLRRIGDRLSHRPRHFEGPKAARAILDAVCAETGITMGEILSRDLSRRVVVARHAAWRRLYAVQEPNGGGRLAAKWSSTRIAEWFNVGHTAILEAVGTTTKSKARASVISAEAARVQ